MLTLYFSGTGNSRYVAECFSGIMKADCFSIEDDIDFSDKIRSNDTICFCYPVYGSCLPIIMSDFVKRNQKSLSNKKIVIICTQHVFSGDGARVFSDHLKGIEYQVIYAEHIRMPNNISNLFFYRMETPDEIISITQKANDKIRKICEQIKEGVVIRRGFNPVSRFLGFTAQRWYFSVIMKLSKKWVKVFDNCNGCSICVQVCPVNNLKIVSKKAQPRGKCILCYRCVNRCPQKAISVMFNTKVTRQYKGINC
ncbi:MAG: EFR1 family ferrodoxin [Spirochaetes bacterium]|nr:EFR1 family ferrodoxin [Spirochaetota bacterium]MBN2772276.1 EFR1 family ferrodoxin [Spirochaetota bacterium]